MYCNKNIKSLLFDFRTDINYIMWLIISILKSLNCNNKRNEFKDYRKISFIIQLIYSNQSLRYFEKFLKKDRLEVSELQKLSSCFLNSKIEENNINSALIMLDRKEIINFSKTKISVNIYSKKLDEFSIIKQHEKDFDLLQSVKSQLYKQDYDEILKEINRLILEEKNA